MAKKSGKYKPGMLLYCNNNPSLVIKLLHPGEWPDTWAYIYIRVSQYAHLERTYCKREEDLDWRWTIYKTIDNDKEEEWV